jgi:hypothetical protein
LLILLILLLTDTNYFYLLPRFTVKPFSSGSTVEDPYPFGGRGESATFPPPQQSNGFLDSYFVSYTAAKIAGWGAPAGPYHPGPAHVSHHPGGPGGGMKDMPPGYPPHPQLMDMYSGVSPATAINTMDWKNTSQVRHLFTFISNSRNQSPDNF